MAGAILGMVFSDENGNGVQDGGEEGLAGATITLLQEATTISITVSASDGAYAFDPVPLGEYTVTETNPRDYISTTEDIVSVSVTEAGQERIVNFGDRIPPIYLPFVANGYRP
jgi:hypothetical protein